MQKGWIKKGILALIILAIFVVPTSLNIKINNILAQTVDPTINVNNTAFSDSVTIGASIKDLPENFEIVVRIYDKKPNISDPPEIKEFGGFIESKEKKEELNLEKVMSETDPKKIEFQKFSLSFKNLKDNTDYWVIVGVVFQKNEKSTIAYKTVSFKTNSTGQGNTNVDDGSGTKVGTPKSTESFGCSIGLWGDMNLGGCILEGLNYVWKASGFVGELAGKFLDFFVYYATNSSSYSNIFVEKAWSAVRDVANIFFIVALLYIAIKTILSLNVTDNKKLIGYVVIIALVINFSLFTTKVVIDGSNILAKIFYNNIVSKDASATNANGTLKDSEAGTEGQKSISIGLIRIFNPQRVVMDAYNSGIGLGYAIFIILLLIAITLYTAYIFFSVAILFVARVVSLWMSMIFSPLAFASYTVPFDIPGFGHKEWWDDLLKNAFLAPLFTFMLYIIVMFAGFLNDVVKYTDNPNMTANGNGMQHVMSITIPFIILMVLLAKAKTLVEKYSGEMGKAVMKGAQMIGGVALGAATGGAALLGTTAIGGTASAVMSKFGEKFKSGGYTTDKEGNVIAKKGMSGYLNRMALKTGDSAQKSSFDLRKTKLGGTFSKTTGMNLESVKMVGLGSKEGGIAGKAERHQKKLEKEAELYKTKMTDDQVKEWSAKNISEYNAKKNETKNEAKKQKEQNGEEFDSNEWEESYEKKNKKPKEYATATALNADRIQAFVDNIGKNSLLSSLSYSLTKKATIEDLNDKQTKYDKKIIKERDAAKGREGIYFTQDRKKEWNTDYVRKNGTRPENNEKDLDKIKQDKAKTTKIIIGAVGAVGALATGGIVGAAAIGTGATLGAREGINYQAKQSGEKAAKTTLTKEINTLGKLETRIKDLNDALAGYNKFLEDAINKDDLVKGDSKTGFEIDQNKVAEKLADLLVIEKKEDLRLKKLVEEGKDDSSAEMKATIKALKDNSKEINRLNRLKTAIKDLNSIKNQLYTTDKDKSSALKKDTVKPNTPSSPAAPTPHK